MKAELSPSDMRIEPVNKDNRIVSLPLTAPPLMPDVKFEGVLAQNASGSGVTLSSNRRCAYEQ